MDGYTIIKRILAVLASVALWFLSIRFSVAGFSIEVADLAWAGWVLGFAITTIELIFTSENRGRNLTLTFLGVAAYSYGIWSNVVGINASRGVDGFSIDFLFSVGLGLFLEIAPEPLFLWGILGGETSEGDIVSTLSRLWADANKRPVGRPKSTRFPFIPEISTRSKVKPDVRDTVSTSRPASYPAATRLAITMALSGSGRLAWDKNKSQSPILVSEDGTQIPVSRSLVRQMVTDNVLVEKRKGDIMVTEYVLTGQEPPPVKSLF